MRFLRPLQPSRVAAKSQCQWDDQGHNSQTQQTAYHYLPIVHSSFLLLKSSGQHFRPIWNPMKSTAKTPSAISTGSGTASICKPQLTSVLGSPLVTQSENTSVHVPFGSLPAKPPSVASRAEASVAEFGSVLRPSETHVPVSWPQSLRV